MERRTFLSLAGSGAALAGVTSSFLGSAVIGARAATNWNWYIYFPSAQLASARGVQRMIDSIEEKTKGELKIRLHLGGSLPISGSNITQAVAEEVVQMADDGFNEGTIPMAGVLRLPMLIENEAEFDKALSIISPHLDKAFEARGVIVLGRYRFPHQVLWSKSKLTSMADLAGQKIRVGSPQHGEFMQAFGAIPVTIPAAEVAPALDRGVVDGAITASSGGGLLWKDILKYSYRIPTGYIESTIIVNKALFEALPAEFQTAIREAVDEGTAWTTSTMNEDEEKITSEMAASGMNIIPPVEGDVALAREKMTPIWESWAAARGDEVKAVLAEVRAALGR